MHGGIVFQLPPRLLPGLLAMTASVSPPEDVVLPSRTSSHPPKLRRE
jgi:hypothetical protein